MPLPDLSLAITINGINCYDEGTREKYGFGQNSEAERVIRCDWADRTALARYFIGGSTQITPLAFVYAAGQPYPDITNWLCNGVDVEGEGVQSVGPNGMVAYERAKLTIHYAPPTFNVTDPFLVGDEDIDFSSIAIGLDQTTSSFKWTSGPNNTKDVPAGQVPAVNLTTITFVKSRYNLPVLPESLIVSLIDHSNSTTFFGAPTETVVFKGGRSQRKITATGDKNWDVQYRFELLSSASGATWNKLVDAANGWQSFTLKDGSKLFPPADLNQLFQ